MGVVADILHLSYDAIATVWTDARSKLYALSHTTTNHPPTSPPPIAAMNARAGSARGDARRCPFGIVVWFSPTLRLSRAARPTTSTATRVYPTAIWPPRVPRQAPLALPAGRPLGTTNPIAIAGRDGAALLDRNRCYGRNNYYCYGTGGPKAAALGSCGRSWRVWAGVRGEFEDGKWRSQAATGHRVMVGPAVPPRLPF